ncbi:hypothetical protein [Mycolicibacterium sp. J2]|uniref:hypothetical protein n=1 Tax=Mycolicibacterium sp. J2 TaxID=2993511 RepID=UPI00224A8653|nr:hypothetical protein [Mycolicibacterium sp. J2]
MLKWIIGCVFALVFGLFALGACVAIFAANSNENPAAPPDPNSPSVMAGNGTFKLGGADGKNWGVYEATATGNCQWSIRSVAPYRDGWILDSGTAAAGEKVSVNIQSDGDVNSLTGEIDGNHRLVFMTNSCGTWRTD